MNFFASFLILEREVLVYHSSSRSRNYDLTIPPIFPVLCVPKFGSVLVGFSLLRIEFMSCFIRKTTSLVLQYRRHLHSDYQLLSWKLLTFKFVLTPSISLSPPITSPFVAQKLSLLRLHSVPHLFLFPRPRDGFPGNGLSVVKRVFFVMST